MRCTKTTGPHAARGVALVIAMILLVILTLLAVTGMSTSVAELVMAGNEQFRLRAEEAASNGIESAIARLAHTPSQAISGMSGSEPPGAGGMSVDAVTTTVRYAGEEQNLPGSSADKLVGLHVDIESTGRSARNAVDVQTQGVLIISPTGGVSRFQRLGGGLQEGAVP